MGQKGNLNQEKSVDTPYHELADTAMSLENEGPFGFMRGAHLHFDIASLMGRPVSAPR